MFILQLFIVDSFLLLFFLSFLRVENLEIIYRSVNLACTLTMARFIGAFFTCKGKRTKTPLISNKNKLEQTATAHTHTLNCLCVSVCECFSSFLFVYKQVKRRNRFIFANGNNDQALELSGSTIAQKE